MLIQLLKLLFNIFLQIYPDLLQLLQLTVDLNLLVLIYINGQFHLALNFELHNLQVQNSSDV